MPLYFSTTDNDTSIGGEENDYIDSYEGEDSLVGGLGDNTFIGGDGDDWLTGGQDNDTVIGEEGDDTLIGGKGNDILVGGLGSDRFFYTTPETVFNRENFGIDVIADFVTASDTIVLDKNTFTSISSDQGIGFSVGEEFAVVSCDAQADTSTADIVYNSVNGNLFYNPNGSESGFGTGGQFATLTGAPTLVTTDFMILAVRLD